MIKLVIMRHGESVGNKCRIIQGHVDYYGITPEGNNQIRLTVMQNADQFHDIDLAFSSDLKRAIETLHCVVEELLLSIPCHSLEILKEVDPGVLGGLSHEQAKLQYPEYYGIWIKRGDLDGIPNAETGSRLQARALAFIHYISGVYDGKTVLVVTHAAFMRSLINTLLARDRTTPICVANGHIHLTTNQLFKTHRKLITTGLQKSVYHYHGVEQQYVIKTITAPSSDTVDIYSYFSINPSPGVCDVYYNGLIDGKLYVVMRFAEGKTSHEKINRDEVTLAWRSVSQVQESLERNKFSVRMTMFDKMRDYQQNGNQSINAIGKQLLALSSNYCMDNNVPVLYDVHRDNLVREKEGWTLVDVEGIIMAPEDFYVACFIAVFLFLEDSTIDMSRYYYLIEDKGWDLNRILLLIGYRLFIGLAYASKHDALTLKAKYMNAFCSWLDIAFEHELTDNKHIEFMRSSIAKV